jgi:uncharacterized protein
VWPGAEKTTQSSRFHAVIARLRGFAFNTDLADFHVMEIKKISIPVSTSVGSVSGELLTGDDMQFLYVFAHGAGAGMDHPFMVRLSKALYGHHIGTLRYNFPYMQNGKKRPDTPAIAHLAVRRAIETGMNMFPSKPVLAGGKSFGGRMTSQLIADDALSVKGLVFVGFPLHPAGSPGTDRADHLRNVKIPMLFLQGTRDALAHFELIQKVTGTLGGATLETFAGADHSFKAGKTDLIPALAESVHRWASTLRH